MTNSGMCVYALKDWSLVSQVVLKALHEVFNQSVFLLKKQS